MYNFKGYAILLMVLIIAFMAASVLAQDGCWVEYNLSTIGAYNSGDGACGDGIVCFAPAGSQYFLVFDVQTGEWQTIDLGTVQDFNEPETEGHVAFAYSDELLFGYSDINMAWDTVYYEGTLMDIIDGYGYSDNLAFFITEMYLYVFDAETGEWASYDYDLPADYTNMAGWAKSDYVGIVLGRTSPALPANVVYSFHTKGFNQIAEGTGSPSNKLDHGLARIMYCEDGNYRLVGYSAYDNQFDVIDYTVDDEARVGGTSDGSIPVDELTVYMDAFRKAESHQYVEAKHYANYTRHGEWVQHFIHLDDAEGNYIGYPKYTGRMALDYFVESDDDFPHLIIFDGTNSVFRNPVPPLNWTDSWSSYLGGNCLLARDNNTAWAYNVAEGTEAQIELFEGTSTLTKSGQDYHTFTRWSSESDSMRTYFYNSRNNSWQYIDVADNHTTSGINSAHYYLHCGSPDNNAVFYSSSLDQIFMIDMPDDGSVSKKISGNLAWASGQSISYLFNGLTGNTTSFNYHISDYGKLGTNSAILCDNDNDLLYGYNPLTETVVTHTITENPYVVADTGYVGILTAYYGGNGYNKIYAYNALANTWIELIPTGTHSSILVGTRTALISRTQGGTNPDYIYAFDPQREVAIEDDDKAHNNNLPHKYALKQNYPNPFNASTLIRYEIPQQTLVRIEIYDIQGRKVTTLVNEEQLAGGHQVLWRADDISSGVYYYKLQAGVFTDTKKMILLK